MAALPNKNINPVLAAVANFCCCAILGYLLIGQARKGLFPFIGGIILSVLSVLGGMVIPIIGGLPFWGLMIALGVLVAIDAYKVAEAVQNGAEVDENEYKFELLYKIMSNIDKQAIYKG